MKDIQVDNFIVKETEFQGKVIKQLYMVVGDKEFLVGTLKDKGDYAYVNCVHREFQKN